MRFLEPILPDRLRSTRALRAFVAVFLAAQVVVGVVVDLHPDERFVWPAKVETAVREAGRPPDVLLLGSSRTMLLSATPGHLTPPPDRPGPWILNAALPACTGPCDEVLMRGALRGSPRSPRLVVVEVSPETVGVASPWLGVDFVRSVTWKDVPDVLPSLYRSEALMAFVSSRFDPVYRHRDVLWRLGLAALGGDPRRLDPPVGPPSRPATAPEAPRLDGSTRGFAKYLRGYRTGGIYVASLRRILDTCRARGIPTVLFSMPLTSVHRQLYRPEIEAPFQELLRELTATYGSRVVDWRDRYPDGYFYDNHHLNGPGAPVVAADLRRLVLEPALAETPP